MTTDERIIKYIDNELSQKDRTAFEMELNDSAELREVLEKYLRVKRETGNLKELKLNPLYLNSIIPEFRKKLDSPKSLSIKKNLGYATGIMLIFILSIAILKNFFIGESESADLKEFTQSLNENERIELLENLSDDSEVYNLISENVSESQLSNLFSANLEINNKVAEAYNIEYYEIVDDLSEDEIELIYNEILNTNF
ncbi:MAG: hypothetical protein MUE93_06195 [Ignavibacteriaceae bacterium]|jgi:hypothetical protein|nr:hypothetical protein [Ignavibacteriaceae bacterium]MCU0406616.1 hypothetical protein [Ignavibacteriaceae bacterium]